MTELELADGLRETVDQALNRAIMARGDIASTGAARRDLDRLINSLNLAYHFAQEMVSDLTQ